MKKLVSIGLSTVMLTGVAMANEDVVVLDQNQTQTAAVEVTAETAFLSAYVWRGQVLNNDFVVQPQISVAKDAFSFNIWGNYDLSENKGGSNGQFSEIDLSLAYTLPVDVNEMSFDVGLINYNFPASGDEATTELFASATVQSWKDYVIPSLTVFADIDQAEGLYVLFDIVAPYQISDYLGVELGASAGWGSSTYNSHYWTSEPNQGEGFNDFNLYAVGSYQIADNLTASMNATYTTLEGGEIRAGAAGFEANNKVWFGVNVAYDF